MSGKTYTHHAPKLVELIDWEVEPGDANDDGIADLTVRLELRIQADIPKLAGMLWELTRGSLGELSRKIRP